MSRQGTVAILGRPNVGKSSFFNYVTGKRISIVEDVPGVTRDRIYEEVEWSGKHFTLIDTGGLEPNSTDTILQQMKRQAELAVELADVILFMCDMKDGVTASDMDIATLIRKTKKQFLNWEVRWNIISQPSCGDIISLIHYTQYEELKQLIQA